MYLNNLNHISMIKICESCKIEHNKIPYKKCMAECECVLLQYIKGNQMNNKFRECENMSYVEKYKYFKNLEILIQKEINNLNNNLTDIKYEIIKLENIQ